MATRMLGELDVVTTLFVPCVPSGGRTDRCVAGAAQKVLCARGADPDETRVADPVRSNPRCYARLCRPAWPVLDFVPPKARPQRHLLLSSAAHRAHIVEASRRSSAFTVTSPTLEESRS